MAELPIPNIHSVALIDDDDLEWASASHWLAYRKRGDRYYYVRTPIGDNKVLHLHREIMAAQPGEYVIFLNYDTLDCRKKNLKLVKWPEVRRHALFTGERKQNYRGVKLSKQGNYTATITIDYIGQYLGTYHDEYLAALAFDRSAREIFELASLNFPERTDYSILNRHDKPESKVVDRFSGFTYSWGKYGAKDAILHNSPKHVRQQKIKAIKTLKSRVKH